MSGKINPKAYKFEEGVKAIFGQYIQGYFESSDSGNPQKHGYWVSFELGMGANITFQQLNRLSELLGTESIDFATGEEGHRYSSWTYDEGTPPQITCWNCQIK